MFEYPVLVGDIGGTNARLALIDEVGARARVLLHAPTRDFETPSTAIRTALDGNGAQARSAILAIAGRIDGPAVKLTNAHWVVEGARIGADFGMSRVVVVNDYVPVAAGAAGDGLGEQTFIGPDLPAPAGPRVVLGPGTGFGSAALVPYEDRLAIVSTEAGHTDFGAADDDDAEIWPQIERIEDRITVEALLSGPGLTRLYAAIHETRTGRPRHCDPARITADGLSGADPHARETLSLFAKLLGRVCGDLALTFLATGGVYIGGGIVPRIQEIMQEGAFRRAFEHKPPFAEMMRAIPTKLIAVQDPALDGLTALAAQAERFVYHGQFWKR